MSDTVTPAALSPVSFLVRSAQVFAPRTAVIHGEQRYTYREFGERVSRAAGMLRQLGIGLGDRVAYLCPNIPAALEGHFALPLLGAIIVPINTRLSPREIAFILDHSGSKALVIDSELAPAMASVLPERSALEHVIVVNDAPTAEPFNASDYEVLLAAAEPVELAEICDDELGVLALNYTSGTTGAPKGVMCTHRGSHLNALAMAMHMGLDSRSSYLWTLPMFHCNGWCFPWAVTAVGATHVCLRKPDPAAITEWIYRGQVSNLCGAPTVMISLANHPGFGERPLPRKLTVMTGGAPPSPQIIRSIERVGAQLVHVYGLTETYGPFTVCEWHPEWDAYSEEERARLKARQGVADITGGELRVVDEEMRDVPSDGQTLGEIVMRGNAVMAGYFDQPEATAKAFRGGWFHSGDLAVRHPDGYVEIRDRGKDIIISGGENISTVEVERILYEHPAVMEVAVIGIPDEKWGEVPKAFVTLKPAAQASADELIEFCREHIARFKCPKAIAFGDLPKTSTGKVQKFLLREPEWQGREKKIN